MNKITKRSSKNVIALLMVVTFLCQITIGGNVPLRAKSTNIKKRYIVVADNSKTYNRLINEMDDNALEENPALSDNNMVVTELTEEEALLLNRKNDVLAEEDFEVEANNTIKDVDKGELFRTIREAEEIAKEEADPEWNLQAIHADEVNVEASGTQKVKVAVLDSGVDIVEGIGLSGSINLVDDEQEISVMFQDLTGHGTGIASVIAGNDDNLVRGVNPNVELYSVKVLDQNNVSPVSRIMEGIYWCIENDINIINMSFGTPTCSHALKKAVEDAYEANILMIGAAGNHASELEYPAAFDEVMAVASTNAKSEISSFSNMGEELDVAAPGEKIRVTGFFGTNGVTHGTSIAVPHVTGVASLLWERDFTKSNEFIRQLISYSTKEIANTNECGLLDAEYAFEIYDAFSKAFDDGGVTNKKYVPENTRAPETFEYVDEDEAYVEGRWKSGLSVYPTQNHQVMAEQAGNAAKYLGLSDAAILLMKKGAIFPDNEAHGSNGPTLYPEWHGGYTYKQESPYIPVNYIGCYEIVTRIALKYGDTSSLTSTLTNRRGTEPKVFNWIKSDISTTKLFGMSWTEAMSISGITYAGQPDFRMFFLYGIAMHIISDSFAHSSFYPGGIGIDTNTRDNPGVIVNRYYAAAKAVKGTAECAALRVQGDFIEYVDASNYYDGSFYMANLLQYADENAAVSNVSFSTTQRNKIKKGNINK